MRTLLLIFFYSYLQASCQKQEIGENKYEFDSYSCVVEHWSMDTTIMFKRVVWWKQDSVYTKEMKQMLDTMKPKYLVMCPIPYAKDYKSDFWLEYTYYTKNNKKIEP